MNSRSRLAVALNSGILILVMGVSSALADETSGPIKSQQSVDLEREAANLSDRSGQDVVRLDLNQSEEGNFRFDLALTRKVILEDLNIRLLEIQQDS
ncbi:MAG: hypothetical protein GXP16_17750 [Gammaproteobacteria bacterium]|nr:hypothetical protein [Gammaproteobacteria bacterium]